MSYLGDDEPGQLVLDRIRGKGVDVSQVRRLEGNPDRAVLARAARPEGRVYYYRQGSAASMMGLDAFDPE